MPPAFFISLKTALAIQGLLWFHSKFRIFFSISVKKCNWNFEKINLSYRWF